MSTFEGFLELYDLRDFELEMRFVVGGYDPSPSEPPVLYVVVTHPEEITNLETQLSAIHSGDGDVYVERISEAEVLVTSYHAEPLSARGSSVALRTAQYEPRDFERLAPNNHQWGAALSQSLQVTRAKLLEVEKLAGDQARRVHIKSQGHAVGSTARTLYDQHIAFIDRLIAALKE